MAVQGGAATALRFVADTPTITMSRLKALLTGGLPTFLDVGKSFSASRLSEDNLLSQAVAAGLRMVFMGDDTWMQLAPDVWTAAAPFPSFNVRDLHTVDDGVWQNLVPALRAPGSWDLLVAHYLGVDHAGHAHGVGSEAMRAKLGQMDVQLAAVIDLLAAGGGPGGPFADTLLLIFGDHGQTLGGDHGGGSADETNSVLIAADVGRLAATLNATAPPARTAAAPSGAARAYGDASGGGARTPPAGDGHCGAGGGAEGYLDAQLAGTCNVGWSCCHSIPQVDLTPTLALLLGLPIPYGNIGKVPLQLWRTLARSRSGGAPAESAAVEGTAAGGDAAAWQRSYAAALAATADQVHAYLESYAAAASLPARPLAECSALYRAARAARAAADGAAAEGASEAHGGAAPSVAASVRAHLAFLEAAAALTRAQFTQFHGGFIWAGCAAAAAVLLWQARLCWRLLAGGSGGLLRWRRGAGGVAAASVAAVAAAAQPQVAWVLLAAGHAVSLFSVGVLMGEGRLLCYEAAALTLLVARGALRAALAARRRVHGSGSAHEAAPAVALVTAVVERAPPRAAVLEGFVAVGSAAARTPKPACTGKAGTLAQRCACSGPCNACAPAPLTAAHAGSEVSVVLCAAALLAVQWALPALGLIDRSGQDPHDKTEPSAELVAGAHGGSAVMLRTLGATLAPLAALLVLLCGADAWLACFRPAPRGPWGKGSAAGAHAAALARFARAAALLEMVCVAGWWVVQLTGYGEATPAGAAAAAVEAAAGGSPASSVPSGGAAAALSAAAAAAARTPLRLLLPRAVYATAVSVLVLFVAGAAAGSAHSALAWPAAARMPGASGGTSQLAAAARALLWLLASLAMPVAMVLGYRGPAFVFLAFAQSTLFLVLLRVRSGDAEAPCSGGSGGGQPARAASPGTEVEESPGRVTGRTACGAADVPPPPPRRQQTSPQQQQGQPGFPVGLVAGAWSLFAMQLFFCSGHFCEFSGLQYTASFIGFDEVEWTAASLLLAANTFGLPALQLLSLPLACSVGALGRGSDSGGIAPNALAGVLAAASTARFAALGVSIVSAAVQVRHILLWAIFAPKLVFEVALAGVADAALVLGAVLWVWLASTVPGAKVHVH